MHCNQCHQFTAEVPLLATRDSAAGTLRPGLNQCLACHQMRERLPEFDPAKDPHNGSCGTCHNPHTQKTPADAAKTCTDAGCHADWRNTPFHTGTAHRKIGEQCLTCHLPHAAKVDPSDCVGCHNAVREKGIRQVRPPLPFDTTDALRREVTIGGGHQDTLQPVPFDISRRQDPPPRGKGDAPLPELRPPISLVVPAAAHPVTAVPADSFPHARHRSLTCITCHVSPGVQTGGKLTFEQPRGCEICHHQRPATNDCARCHQPTELATPITRAVAVEVKDHAPRTREVPFRHAVHDSLACSTCHTTPVSLAPAAPVASCTDCHADHHTGNRACATCHSGREVRQAHKDDRKATHQQCDACHDAATVKTLVPDRSFCATCHQKQATDHFPAKECTTCHFLASPTQYRSHLTGGTPK